MLGWWWWVGLGSKHDNLGWGEGSRHYVQTRNCRSVKKILDQYICQAPTEPKNLLNIFKIKKQKL
jgi:hypothetical protein